MIPIPLPPPYNGVNEQIPVVSLQSPFCETILNFNLQQNGAALRSGDSKYALLNPGGAGDAYSTNNLATWGDYNAFEIAYNLTHNRVDFIDVDAGSIAYSTSANGNANFYPVYYKSHLFFFCGNNTSYRPGVVFDGSSWTNIGYTDSLGGNINAGPGCSYKERIYFLEQGSASFWYSEPQQISGTATKVDLSSILSEYGIGGLITPITIADNVSAVTFLAFVFSTGEVLFYSGSYPNGADWTLAGRASIGPLLAFGSGQAYQGDYLVFTYNGVVSLRDLFLKGSEDAASLTVNSRIQKTWRDYIDTGGFSGNVATPSVGIYSCWDKKNNRIIIMFPGYVDTSTNPHSFKSGAFYFIFDTIQQAWIYHKSFGSPTNVPMSGLIYYRNNVLMSARNKAASPTAIMVFKKEGASDFLDRSATDLVGVGYDYLIQSAPVSQDTAYVQKAEGMDVIIESDLYPYTYYSFIRDLGVASTTPQLIATQASTTQKAYVNMGIEGSYIQYKISGNTTLGGSVGYKLYASNIWVETGNSPR